MFNSTASHLLFSEVVLQVSDKRIKNINFKFKKKYFLLFHCAVVMLHSYQKNYGKNSCAEVTIYVKMINIELLISIIVLVQIN